MNKTLLIIIAAVSLLSCSKEHMSAPERGEKGWGMLAIGAGSDMLLASETRAVQKDVSELGVTAPEVMEMRTLVSCRDRSVYLDGEKPWRAFVTAAAHNDEACLYEVADYVITIGTRNDNGSLPHYYDPSTGSRVDNTERPYCSEDVASRLIPRIPEGENLPYFEGRADVAVTKGETVTADVTVTVANTVVCVEFTDAFRNYFPNGATIKIATRSAGTGNASDEKYFRANTFTAGYAGADDVAGPYVKKYFWVRPQDFTLSGTAVRQHPAPGVVEAGVVTLGEYKASGIRPRTLYTYTFDIDNAGHTGSTGDDTASGIRITINDQPIEIIEEDYELNPNASKE